MASESSSLEYTSIWVVAAVCFVIVLISLLAERAIHRLGKFLKKKNQEGLFEALQKLKDELMLLGFISLLLTVSQGAITGICIPPHVATTLLPCKLPNEGSNHEKYIPQSINNRRKLLSVSSNADHCREKGKVPLVSLEALHHLHIFIFVLAVVHVIFCVSTMLLAGARIQQWKKWEESIRHPSKVKDPEKQKHEHHHFSKFPENHEKGHWRRSAVISWVISLFKQFYGSITKSDYIALRKGFMATHCPHVPNFDFHKYMMRTLELDFKRTVTIRDPLIPCRCAYCCDNLWLFIVIFLLLNVEGWPTYFWLAFLPVLLLLGAKLEHVIFRLGQKVAEKKRSLGNEEAQVEVEPSDEHFWLDHPAFVLDLIQFILFQNSFEIAFFFWIWSTHGFHSSIMEKLGYIVPRLVMGVMVQVLCSYSTLPLYALVSQMGSKVRKGFFGEDVHSAIQDWRAGAGRTHRSTYSAESPTTLVHGTSPTPFLDDDTTTTTMSITDTHH